MIQNAIEIKGVSKVYPLSQSAQKEGGPHEKFALADVNLTIPAGSVTGLIGMNGAGKSTLLKLIAQITPPSEGSIRVQGNVLSILEVGVGFLPENTGRENVLLYGSLMGIKRSSMREKLPEIIEFSGVGEYIDQPVKFYSSGMYLRLAFSVLIALDADIFLFDEVLSVGDISFRAKVLSYIRSLKKLGKTVIIVSHAPSEIADLCDQMIVLHQGVRVFSGLTVESIQKLNEIVNVERNNSNASTQTTVSQSFDFPVLRIEKAERRFPEPSKALCDRFEEIVMEFVFEKKTTDRMQWTFNLLNAAKQPVLSTSTILNQANWTDKTGRQKLILRIPPRFLCPGYYSLDAYVTATEEAFKVSLPNILNFQVNESSSDDQCRYIPSAIYTDLLTLNMEEC